MLGRYTQRVEADAASTRQTAGSVGGLSSRMMVPRNTSDGSWRRGGTTQQFMDGILPLPTQPCDPAPALPSATEVFQEQVAEQQKMVTAGARPSAAPHAQPFGLDAPDAKFPERADSLSASDIEGSSTPAPYTRTRVPLEHQEPDRIAPDGSVVFVESKASHKALMHRVANQSGYNNPASRGTVGWESAPDVVPQARPKELHRPIERSCTVLHEVVTGDSRFMPVYKRSYTGWDNKDIEGARPPGSPGHFATTHGRARRSRMAPAQQPVAVDSPPCHVGGDAQYQPSWSPSALATSSGSAQRSPAMRAYGEPIQERGKKPVSQPSRSNTVWSMMHSDTAAEEGTVVLSPRSRLR